MDKSEQFIKVNEKIKLWVETFGNPSGTACIFFAGAGANSSFWPDGFCKRLSEKNNFVIKFDWRDTGYSTKINYEKDSYDILELVKDSLGILNFFKIQKANVIGHSMGGFVAQLLAIEHPDKVLSITSISSSTNSPTVPPPSDKTWKVLMNNKPQNNFEKDLPGFMEVWRYLNGTASFDEELAVAYTKSLYERQEIDGPIGENHVKAQATLSDRSELLQKVTVPALVIHGEQDYLVDKLGGIQTARSIPNAHLVLIPRMGHISFNYEINKQLENEIIKFLVQKQLLDNL